jgi:hypothetical protein
VAPSRVPQCLAGLGNEMKARKLLDAAPFKPDIIKALKQVFDEAWASIVYSIDPTTVENASSAWRMRLLPTRACLERMIWQL